MTIAWIAWRLFLRKWAKSFPIFSSIYGAIVVRKIPIEIFYEQATQEIEENTINRGVWAKAWSDAEGNNTKARALYIRYRAQEIRHDASNKIAKAAFNRREEQSVVSCPRCSQKCRVPAGRKLNINCPKCKTQFSTHTPPPKFKDSYGVHFARYIYAVGACFLVFAIFSMAFSISSEILNEADISSFIRIAIKMALWCIAIASCILTWKFIVKTTN